MRFFDDLKTEIDANHSLNPTVIDGAKQSTAKAVHVILIHEGLQETPISGIGRNAKVISTWSAVLECQADTETLVTLNIIETRRLINAKVITDGHWELIGNPHRINRVGCVAFAILMREVKTIDVSVAI